CQITPVNSCWLWWMWSQLFNQDVGLPPLLPVTGRSMCPAPLIVPYISGSMCHPGQKIIKEQYRWRVSLDLAHFSPSEISLSVGYGFLEVRGKHEEKPDEYGFIARCFTRKYRLPAETDVTKMASMLSADGILTVEAPVPETSVPAVTCIPIKVITSGKFIYISIKKEQNKESEAEKQLRETAQRNSSVSTWRSCKTADIFLYDSCCNTVKCFDFFFFYRACDGMILAV
uniref:SHSP domain-containing protein n=1 Tax=Mola mola TaxID=94237 RepID=A0A3Q3VVX2_MOLML